MSVFLRKTFQDFPRHVCVAISCVVIRSKTGGLLYPSEVPEPGVCANEIVDPDCPEMKILLLQVKTRPVWGLTMCSWVLHRPESRCALPLGSLERPCSLGCCIQCSKRVFIHPTNQNTALLPHANSYKPIESQHVLQLRALTYYL